MARLKNLQTAFSGGAVSSSFEGRVDLDAYFKSARDIKNCYVDNIGAAFRREGQAYIDNTDSDQAARLISFEFNTEQTYLIEFTPGQFRVFTDDTVTATVTSSPISSLTATQIDEMDYVQSADTLILVHQSMQPIEITRTSDSSWTASNITFDNIPQFTFSDTAGSATNEVMQITLAIGSAGDASFRFRLEGELSDSVSVSSSDTGPQIATKIRTAFRNLAKTSATGITVSNSGTTVFNVTFGGDDGGYNWITPTIEDERGFDAIGIASTTDGGPPEEDVWSATRGWPRTATFFEGRLWLGGSDQRPQTLWGSVVNDFFNFNVGTGLDNEALDITIDDDQVNAIQYLSSGRTLSAFTTGGEFAIIKELDKPITPTTVSLRKQTQHGSARVRPVKIDGTTLFVEGAGNVVREFVYNELEQSYIAPNVSVFTDYTTDIKRAAVRRSVADANVSYTYFVNEDGTVAVLNKLKEQEIRAFTLFTTNGTYEDVAVVGNDVYFVVNRTINSSTVRFIEKLDRDKLLDASVRVDNGSDTDTFSGFSHLNSNDVYVLGALDADDLLSPMAENTVSSGSITTEFEVQSVEVGLAFFALIETLPIEVSLGSGQLTSGDYKRIVFVTPKVLNSRQIIVQTPRATYRPSWRNFGSALLDQPVQLFTGSRKIWVSGVNRDITVKITQEEPLEFTVLSATMGVSV